MLQYNLKVNDSKLGLFSSDIEVFYISYTVVCIRFNKQC